MPLDEKQFDKLAAATFERVFAAFDDVDSNPSDGFFGIDRAVGFNLHHQLVQICPLFNTSIFDRVRHATNWAV